MQNMWKNGARLDLGPLAACSAQNPTDFRQVAIATSRRMRGPVDGGLAGSDRAVLHPVVVKFCKPPETSPLAKSLGSRTIRYMHLVAASFPAIPRAVSTSRARSGPATSRCRRSGCPPATPRRLAPPVPVGQPSRVGWVGNGAIKGSRSSPNSNPSPGVEAFPELVLAHFAGGRPG
jgi:hypothetical protein